MKTRDTQGGYVRDGVGYIPISQEHTVMCDPEDLATLSQWKWSAQAGSNTHYARRGTWDGKDRRKSGVFMHRQILNAPANRVVDHKNGNGLDNRKANLRLCSKAENNYSKHASHGKSKFRGVSWSKSTSKWQAALHKNNKMYHLGVFANEEDAAIAYNVAAQLFFGEFASLNNV